MSKTKPNRMYHAGKDKYGDVLSVNNNFVTCRFDGEKGTNCYEVDAPYIKMLILAENLKPEPLPENPLTELLKDKERLDWILSDAGRFWLSTREDIDKEMEEQEPENYIEKQDSSKLLN